MKYITLLLSFLFPVYAGACVHSIVSNPDFVRICSASDSCRQIDLVDLTSASHTLQADQLKKEFQEFLDERIPLLLLESVDPSKASDPGCENFFWGDVFGDPQSEILSTHLIARNCVIDSVVWNTDRFIFSLRRSDRCQ